jgi:hypothetical protein
MTDVDCSRIRDAFRAGRSLDDPASAAHVSACSRCAELVADEARLGRALGAPPPDVPAQPHLWAAIERDVRAETGVRAWLRSRPTSQRVALAAGVVVLAALLARREVGGGSWARPGAEPWLWLASFAVLAAASLAVLLRPLGRSSLSRPAVWAVLASSLALPVAHALSSEEASQFGVGSGVARGALGCFLYGLGLALPFVLLVLLLDRSDRLTARGLVLVAGAGALVANLGLLLHCGLDQQEHLLAGHAPIGLAFLLGLFTVRAIAVRR